MTLRQKATLYFSLGFIVLWTGCCFLLFQQFRKSLLHFFDEEMEIRAMVVAERTSVDPTIIPLPQQNESYLILYENAFTIDTLFSPTSEEIADLFQNRYVEIKEESDEGTLIILYTFSSDEIDLAVRQVFTAIIIILLFGIALSWLAGYWLSGKIIKPVDKVIKKANKTDLLHDIHLLDEPDRKDEIGELIISFNRMLLRIKDQATRQNAFFASASHELRTPLTVMQTRLEVLLREENIPEQTSAFFGEQLAEVKRMIRMVNDFLLMSELQYGDIPVHKTECDLLELVTDSLSLYQNRSREKGLTYKLRLLPEEHSFTVLADPEKMKTILRNLLENTLKYSKENSTVDIQIVKEDQIILQIRNKIRGDIRPPDEGILLPYRHSKPLHGDGSGLGLWISRQLAELQGFHLLVSAHGEDFHVSLFIPTDDQQKMQ